MRRIDVSATNALHVSPSPSSMISSLSRIAHFSFDIYALYTCKGLHTPTGQLASSRDIPARGPIRYLSSIWRPTPPAVPYLWRMQNAARLLPQPVLLYRHRPGSASGSVSQIHRILEAPATPVTLFLQQQTRSPSCTAPDRYHVNQVYRLYAIGIQTSIRRLEVPCRQSDTLTGSKASNPVALQSQL
jgi:hypothetical protein